MTTWNRDWALTDDGRSKTCKRCGEMAAHLGIVTCARCLRICANFPTGVDFIEWLEDVLTIREQALRAEIERLRSDFDHHERNHQPRDPFSVF